MTPIYAYFNILKWTHCSIDTAKDFYLTYDQNQSIEGSYAFIASPIKVNRISADPTTCVTHYILLNREQVDAKLTELFPEPLTIFENEQPIEMMLIRTKPLTTQEVNDLFGFVPTIDIIKAFPPPQAIRAQENEDYYFAKQQAHDTSTSINHESICASHSVRLITLLNESLNTLTIQNATNALANLATNSINQNTIRENLGIAPLIELLNTSDAPLTKKFAAAALAHLAINPINQNTIRENLGIAPLIALLNTCDDSLSAAAALAHLAKNSINQNTIREKLGIAPLIALLNTCDNPLTKQFAASALANLATNSINQNTIRENLGIAPLIELLNTSDAPLTKKFAAVALANLATNSINQNTIRENLGIVPLIALLNTCDNPLTKQHAAFALASLAVNPINQNTIRENLGIAPLIALLNTCDDSLSAAAAAALAHLAKNSINQNTIREKLGIAPLIALLNTCDNPLTKQFAASALASLAANSINQNTIRENFGITPLIALLNTCDNSLTKRYAACALANLGTNLINQNSIRESVGIETLIALLNYCEDTLTKQYAARALAHLALNPINQHIILNNNVIMPLIALFKTCDDTQTQLYAADALISLFINKNYIHALTIGLAIIALSTTLNPEQLTIFNMTNAILWTGIIILLVKTQNSLQFTKQQLVDITENHRKNIYADIFIKLSVLLNQNLNTKTTRDAAHTLANLAENSINQNIIRENIGIPVLIALSNSCEDALTRQYAARVLLLVNPTTNPMHQNTIDDSTDINNVNTSSVSTPTLVTSFSIFTPSAMAKESNTEMNIERNEEGHLSNLS